MKSNSLKVYILFGHSNRTHTADGAVFNWDWHLDVCLLNVRGGLCGAMKEEGNTAE